MMWIILVVIIIASVLWCMLACCQVAKTADEVAADLFSKKETITASNNNGEQK